MTTTGDFMQNDEDLAMRLAGLTKVEPMLEICEHLFTQELDQDTHSYVEQVHESLIEFEDLLDEIEDRDLSMTVDETLDQLEVLASIFSLHAMRIAKRVHTTCRALNQNAHFVLLRRSQQELIRAQEEDAARIKERDDRFCSSCGGCMVPRTRQVDNAPFWGCEHFPTCRRAFSMNAAERLAFKRQTLSRS